MIKDVLHILKTVMVLCLMIWLGTDMLYSQEDGSIRAKKFSRISQQSISQQDQVRIYLEDAATIFDAEPEKALDLVHDALLINIKENYLDEEAASYKLLGDFNYKLGEFGLSLKNYQKALAIYNELQSKSTNPKNHQDVIYEINYLAGKSAEHYTDYDKGIKNYQQFLNEARIRKSRNDISKGLVGLGNVNMKLNKLTEAEGFYNEALDIEKEEDNKQSIVLINLRLGELEEKRKNENKAIDYYRQSQSSAEQIEDDKGVNVAYNNISEIYKNQKNIDDDISINQEALSYNQKRNNMPEVSANNIGLADLKLQKSENDEAIELLEQSIKISEKAGDLKNKTKAVEVLSKAYVQKGDADQALKKYNEYKSLQDSIVRIESNYAMNEMRRGEILENAQNKLTILEKDKALSESTIELLRKEKIIHEASIKRQRLISYGLLFGFLVLLTTSYLVFRSNKEKNKANQLLALKSLRAQMNPHFIFNALNSVNSFISNSDEKSANRYLSEFSRLMRDVMENSQEDFIPLSKEINILELYLKLEHDRFKDKFDYRFEVDKSINVEECFIPPMLVQPYIENAVWHGLRYKKEKGFLDVDISKIGESVVITVSDDGIGRKQSQLLKTKNQMTLKSTGMKNIDSRLKIIKDIYKTKLDISISDLDEKNGSGTKVSIKIFPEENHE